MYNSIKTYQNLENRANKQKSESWSKMFRFSLMRFSEIHAGLDVCLELLHGRVEQFLFKRRQLASAVNFLHAVFLQKLFL